MEIVSRPVQLPGHCILSLKAEDPEGFVDFGITPQVTDPRVYASVSVLREYGRKLGLVDGGVVEGLERRVADLEAQLAESDRELDAIHVLRARGYTPAKKPGRPPTKKAA